VSITAESEKSRPQPSNSSPPKLSPLIQARKRLSLLDPTKRALIEQSLTEVPALIARWLSEDPLRWSRTLRDGIPTHKAENVRTERMIPWLHRHLLQTSSATSALTLREEHAVRLIGASIAFDWCGQSNHLAEFLIVCSGPAWLNEYILTN
jgi:hypothetical protein